MGTFELPIKDVTAQVLKRLVDDRVKEGLQLEYKETLPNEKGREKFLTSITALVNSAGGDLIYGIRAKRDEEDTPTGEPDSIVGITGVNLDQEKLRLEQWIRTCIEPPLIVTMEIIERGIETPCLLIRVPRSWSGLHMVKTYDNPFYGRNSGGKYPLSITEIRAGFVVAETVRDRVRQYRGERIGRILREEAPTNLGPGPKIVFHALPLNFDEEVWLRFRNAERDAAVIKGGIPLYLHLQLINRPVQNWHYNTDGFLTKTVEPHNSYVQVFRNGGIEAVDVTLIRPRGLDDRNDELKVIHGINIERGVIRVLQGYQRFWTFLGVAGPIALFLTLTGVSGCGIIAKSGQILRHEFVGFDRDCLMTSDVVMADLSVAADRALKPLFDFIWNAGGYAESPHYNKDDSWVGDQNSL